MDIALGDAQSQSKPSSGTRGSDLSKMTTMLSQAGAGGFVQQAEYLQAQSDQQAELLANSRGAANDPLAHGMSSAEPKFNAPPGTVGGPPGPGIPGMSPNFDPMKTAAQIYVSSRELRNALVINFSSLSYSDFNSLYWNSGIKSLEPSRPQLRRSLVWRLWSKKSPKH